MIKTSSPSLGAIALGLVGLATATDADACGGCFHGQAARSERASVVTDHRMVLALSAEETTLWDQFRWAGRPEDFVWALPISDVRRARVAVSDDDFLNELDAVTAPVVASAPSRPPCPSSQTNLPSATPMRPREEVVLALQPMVRAGDPDGVGSGGPSVIREATVGPYQTLLLDGRSADQRLGEWLTTQGYAVPEAARGAMEHYTQLGVGWIVLRLRPGEGVSRMTPVRVSLDGYHPTLPLRMITAGSADRTALTLMVVSNGAMREADAPEARVDVRRLAWPTESPRSNYGDLFRDALGDLARPAWVTESIVPWRGSQRTGTGAVVTRLRTFATSASLERDLRLEPSDSAPFGPRFRVGDAPPPDCPTPPPVSFDLPPLAPRPGCQCSTAPGPELGPWGASATLVAFALGVGRHRRRVRRVW